MDAIIAYIIVNWQYILIGVMVIDKIVAMSKTKYDDLIWSSIKGLAKKLIAAKKSKDIPEK